MPDPANIRTGDIVLLDEETATTEPQPGEYVRLEGYRIHEINMVAEPPFIVLEKR